MNFTWIYLSHNYVWFLSLRSKLLKHLINQFSKMIGITHYIFSEMWGLCSHFILRIFCINIGEDLYTQIGYSVSTPGTYINKINDHENLRSYFWIVLQIAKNLQLKMDFDKKLLLTFKSKAKFFTLFRHDNFFSFPFLNFEQSIVILRTSSLPGKMFLSIWY